MSKKTTSDPAGSLAKDTAKSAGPAVVDESLAAPGQDGMRRLTASVDILNLAKGLYLFSARTASPQASGDNADLLLPAVQVGPGPGVTSDQFAIMSSPATNGAWLSRQGDALVAKVMADGAPVILTSVRLPDMTPLALEVSRLDGDAPPPPAPVRAAPIAAAAPPAAPAQLGYSAETGGTPLRIVAHIQNRGDVTFVDTPWAGFAGQRLAVEGFSVSPLSGLDAAQLEYKALTAARSETPWVSGGALCGTRGQGLPLVGFCVRVKPQADGKRYDCEYKGTFASGKVVGPAKNGAPCWSTTQGDFLEALQIKIVERPG